ncbi:G domain-containing protein [Pleurotus pulmonarius]
MKIPILRKNNKSLGDEPAAGRTVEAVVIVMGLTGSGKSTFINTATQDSDAIPVGHGLESTTLQVLAATTIDPRNGSGKILLVESPAFSYEMQTIRNSERQLVRWLDDTSYSFRRDALRVLYLGKISDPRTTISPFIHLGMFERILGDNFNQKVHLATTMWTRAPPSSLTKAEQREKELQTTQWQSWLNSGSRYHRFDGTHESAWSIIEDVIKPASPDLPNSYLQRNRFSRVLNLFTRSGSTTYMAREGGNDLYIAIVGFSGSGKSSFINALSGGEGCQRCDRPLVFIDTPGLDDHVSPDPGGLRGMEQQMSIKKDILSCIIYLHRIEVNRMVPTQLSTLLRKIRASSLCRKNILPTSLFVTTMWDEVGEEKGNHQFNLLRSHIPEALQIVRHDTCREPAWALLDDVVRKANAVFAAEVAAGVERLIHHLRSYDPSSSDARQLEALAEQLAESLPRYNLLRARFHTKLTELQAKGYGRMISELVWQRARIQL